MQPRAATFDTHLSRLDGEFLTKAEASRRIDELRQKAGLDGGSGGDGGAS